MIVETVKRAEDGDGLIVRLYDSAGQRTRASLQVGVPVSEAYGVQTYYTLFRRAPVGRFHLQVDTNIPAAESLALVVPYLSDKGLKEEAASAVVTIAEKLVASKPAEVGDALRKVVEEATNAIVTFSIYPSRLFDASARLLLFTLVPAMLVGAVPAELVRGFTWERAGLLALGALAFFALAGFVFYRGLRRYESGSAIQIQS